ncbi:PAS domain S-box protein [bacterium]|nr:PAS domain S-box protein [bacterium]
MADARRRPIRPGSGMDFFVGALVGGAIVLLTLVLRELWYVRQQVRTLAAELATLEMPLLVVRFPGRDLLISDPMRGNLDVTIPEQVTLDAAVERLVLETDRQTVRTAIGELRAGVQSYREFSFNMRMRDGRWHEMRAQAFRVGSFGLRAGLVAVTLEDVTQSREIVEERDRLFNLSIDLMAIGDLSGRLLQVNPAWVRVLRWSRDDIMERTFPDLIHPDDRPLAEQALADLRDGLSVRELELRTMARDGSFRWISWNSIPLTARRTVFTVARDITDRKLAEEQLQRYQERLKRLANELSTIEERERRRLAETLHDTLAQDLFAAQAKLTLLKYPDRVADVAAVRDEAAAILDHASELARTLTFELFPPALYEVGLDAALEWLCRSFRKTRGLPCEFRCDGEPTDLSVERRALLYQGARELLGNVFRHAGATRAEVTVVYADDTVDLRVDDDGRGFDFPSAGDDPDEDDEDDRPDGFGLFNIRERLGQVGGRLNIETSHLGGGRVTLQVPLSATTT